MRTKPLILALLAGPALSGAAQAALIDRGGGLIYDDVLNITWLADANYAKTSGYAVTNEVDNGLTATNNIFADGRMGWDAANDWAENLVYGGFDNWRLPTLGPVNGSYFDYNLSYDGSTDIGYNITSPQSELAYMYYVNLGLKGFFNPDKTSRSDYGIFGDGTGGLGAEKDFGLIDNLQAFIYWSGLEYEPVTNYALGFGTIFGIQNQIFKYNESYAWAVRDGDVAAQVSEPTTLLLLGLGLAGLGAMRRRG